MLMAPGKTSPDSPDRVYSEKTTTDARFLHLFVVDTRCTNIAQRIHVKHLKLESFNTS